MIKMAIHYEKEKFLTLLLEKYYERCGLVPGTSKPADDLCIRFTEWLYVRQRFNSLLIQGRPGTGKTTLMEAFYAALSELAERGVVFENIRFKIQAAKLENAEWLREGLIETLSEAKGLIIDDLGHESPIVKDYGRDYRPAEMILKQRSDNQLPTIVTTNLSLDMIEKQYDSPRLADVLSQYDRIILESNKSFRRL